jgi:hypothetical protein
MALAGLGRDSGGLQYGGRGYKPLKQAGGEQAETETR